jgi:hypothetical protein
MPTLTTNGSGAASAQVATEPGCRYMFRWVKTAGLLAGTLTPSETTEDADTCGFSEWVSGGSPVAWNLASESSGRMEFRATAKVFNAVIAGGTASQSLRYVLLRLPWK